MIEPLEERYFVWLYDQIRSSRAKIPSRNFYKLAKQLHDKEFIWVVANDDNRVEDGRDLRYEFLNQNREYVSPGDAGWLDLGCSMLEMLIGLSRRLAFETDGTPHVWFWVLLGNLDLVRFNDALNVSDAQAEEIDDVLNRVIWRTYSRDGSGGLFPLRRARHDQRKVELWYQLQDYILENE